MAIDWWLRPGPRRPAPSFFSDAELDEVRTFYAAMSGATPTPLHRLPGLAAKLGIEDVLVKDESGRFGLPAFKIVGARYAIGKLVEQRGGRLRHLACATAGNHGRAVAHAAHGLGLEAHVYVPVGTTPARVEALRSEGAHVVVTSVEYDDTVRLMAEDAAESGWTIVSDTAWPGYEQIPRWIMAGYTRLLEEAATGWGARPPDILIVQAGVGSLAGAVAGWLVARFGDQRPHLVTAEPAGAACVLESLRAGRLASLASCAPTAMVGLRCGEVSPLAWTALEPVVDAAIAIGDDLATEAIDRLEHPLGSDPRICSGASGAAGVAALLALSRDPALAELRGSLGIDDRTRVVTLVTEGDGSPPTSASRSGPPERLGEPG
ncbi:MAG TPA: diaminopropionate ammonia-lyase [Vicinamibacterales bacterium]|nr:diaminopropionate ammonia-lyase [Vicinamibacterales bacterium]